MVGLLLSFLIVWWLDEHPTAAALLAFVAWQSGDGALANVALDRALADDPRYSMALLLRQVITAGAPPSPGASCSMKRPASAAYTERPEAR